MDSCKDQNIEIVMFSDIDLFSKVTGHRMLNLPLSLETGNGFSPSLHKCIIGISQRAYSIICES